jgi:hypothetical protein
MSDDVLTRYPTAGGHAVEIRQRGTEFTAYCTGCGKERWDDSRLTSGPEHLIRREAQEHAATCRRRQRPGVRMVFNGPVDTVIDGNVGVLNLGEINL